MSTLEVIYQQLCSPPASELLLTHPNDLASSGFQVPPGWKGWWEWATSIDDDENTTRVPRWMSLVRYYCAATPALAEENPLGDPSNKYFIPPELKTLIDVVIRLQLGRDPVPIGSALGDTPHRSYGMSPKKEHEVSRMAQYISRLLSPGSAGSDTLHHVVDVGSGQGYLSRALNDLGLHVLALDSNQDQTSGAERWKSKEAARRHKQLRRESGARSMTISTQHCINGSPSTHFQLHRSSSPSNSIIDEKQYSLVGSLTHQTIRINLHTLQSAIHDWLLSDEVNQTLIGELPLPSDGIRRNIPQVEPVPVMIVALHACGSLTPDVLRAFLSKHSKTTPPHVWTAQALMVVGCCYNLMTPEDFPLSRLLRQRTPVATLPLVSRHLAAQIPSQWLRNETSMREASLAIRKVTFRALLQPVLEAIGAQEASAIHTSTTEEPCGVGQTPENRRLGKLPDAAYKDWKTFLERVTSKIGVQLDNFAAQLPVYMHDESRRKQLESALSVLHVLRCIMGPLIESLILLDRYEWIREELSECDGLQESNTMDVDLINLFDQATGSGRNIAIVIKPREWPSIN